MNFAKFLSRPFLQNTSGRLLLLNISLLLHSSIKQIPTLLKLYINTGLVLIACALPVKSIFPSFLKNLDIKVENKIVSELNILWFLYFKGRNMTTLKMTLFP